VAVARRSRTFTASPDEIWDLIADPDHLPRWWPGVSRVEGVEGDRFTEVLTTKRGRPVRADFRIVQSDRPYGLAWMQEVEGTPFQRVLSESIVAIGLSLVADGTTVTIEQRQKLRGYSRTGGFLLRRATSDKLDEALDGIERILG
jgi:uncharacterized protein YndB with AHSA1/START domain